MLEDGYWMDAFAGRPVVGLSATGEAAGSPPPRLSDRSAAACPRCGGMPAVIERPADGPAAISEEHVGRSADQQAAVHDE